MLGYVFLVLVALFLLGVAVLIACSVVISRPYKSMPKQRRDAWGGKE